jgi:SAM-dependent methyltransferase
MSIVIAVAPGLVGPGGAVVLSDLVPEMTEIAAARAHASGLTNLATRQLDLQQIDEPDASYDVVVCREALMLVPEPAVAVAEMRRVLRPGGRMAVAVWGPRPQNPWLGALFDAVTAVTGMPVPPPGIPGPFSLEDASQLHQLLSDAAFDNISIDEVDEPLVVDSFDDWWAMVPALAGPLASLIASLPPEVVAAIRHHGETALHTHRTAEGFHLRGVSLVASARRP